MSEWNDNVIAEFRANAGKVGGYFENQSLTLLHTTGAKSGEERINPLMVNQDGDRMVVIASFGGAPTNPDWYHNLKANPRATMEVGTETFDVVAHEAGPEERDRIYGNIAGKLPQFAEYETKTTRKIPVMILERI